MDKTLINSTLRDVLFIGVLSSENEVSIHECQIVKLVSEKRDTFGITVREINDVSSPRVYFFSGIEYYQKFVIDETNGICMGYDSEKIKGFLAVKKKTRINKHLLKMTSFYAKKNKKRGL